MNNAGHIFPGIYWPAWSTRLARTFRRRIPGTKGKQEQTASVAVGQEYNGCSTTCGISGFLGPVLTCLYQLNNLTRIISCQCPLIEGLLVRFLASPGHVTKCPRARHWIQNNTWSLNVKDHFDWERSRLGLDFVYVYVLSCVFCLWYTVVLSVFIFRGSLGFKGHQVLEGHQGRAFQDWRYKQSSYCRC